MIVKEYEIDTRDTTNTGDHRAVIEHDDGVYIVSREIDGQSDVQAKFDAIEEAEEFIEENYFIRW